MANQANIYEALQVKLIVKYPTKSQWADLWQAYWADAANGNNAGIPKVGDALIAHIGGTGSFADRFQAWAVALVLA